MKSVILVTLSFLLFCGAQSQKAIIRFEGVNDAQQKFYAVDIEGRKFDPAAGKQSSTSGVKLYEINYLRSGAHDLLVYPVSRNASYGNRNQAIYNNRFHLKDGHETMIIVRNNGQVTLVEKPIKNSEPHGESNRAMSMQQFSSLYAAMKNQDDASNRYVILKKALDVPTNYFTIFQLNNLLSLIHSEAERLVLAKQSSSHLLEEANAAALLDVFSLQASKEELARHFGIKN